MFSASTIIQGQFSTYQTNGYSFTAQPLAAQQQQQQQQQPAEYINESPMYTPTSTVQTAPHPVLLTRVVEVSPGIPPSNHWFFSLQKHIYFSL